MSLDFEQIKQATKKEKLIISGYIRRCKSMLPKNNSYYNIPELVYFICIAFYRDIEYFTKYGDDVKINDKRNKASIKD